MYIYRRETRQAKFKTGKIDERERNEGKIEVHTAPQQGNVASVVGGGEM